MNATRFGLLLDAGFNMPQAGRIAVWHPPAGSNLSGLPSDRSVVIQPFKPALDQFDAAGFDVAPVPNDPDRFALSIVTVPRSKTEARALIATASALTDGPCVVDGQKTDGADSLLKAVRARGSVGTVISKAHGKLFVIEDGDFSDWAQGPALTPGGFWTAPGVFSADGIDPASAMLADALPARLGAYVADLGAGWGMLSAHVLTRPDIVRCHLVEAHFVALECARRNITDPRAAFHWADATSWSPTEPLDGVVMNPPFHTDRRGDPSLGQAFIATAARMLKPTGSLYMVANRHLPYEAHLASAFTKIVEMGGDARFKLLHAERPRRRGRHG